MDFISTNLATGTTYSIGQSSVSSGLSIPGGMLATPVFDVSGPLRVWALYRVPIGRAVMGITRQVYSILFPFGV